MGASAGWTPAGRRVTCPLDPYPPGPNLAGHVFQGRNSETEREEILGSVEGAAGSRCAPPGHRFRLDRLDRIDRQLLHERHLVSKELAGLDPDGRVRSGASVLVQERIGVMLNEEDHLRIQVSTRASRWTRLRRGGSAGRRTGQRLAFAFHPEFGLSYLLSDQRRDRAPRIGVDPPARARAHQGNQQGTARVGSGRTDAPRPVWRGQRGRRPILPVVESDHAWQPERELLDHLGKMVRQVMDYEEQARQVLLRDAATVIEDKVWRAYGLLRYARSLSFEEAMNLLSPSGWEWGRSHPRCRHVHAQQAADLHAAGAPGGRGRHRSRRCRPAVSAARFVRKVLESEVGRRG